MGNISSMLGFAYTGSSTVLEHWDCKVTAWAKRQREIMEVIDKFRNVSINVTNVSKNVTIECLSVP